MRDGDKDFPPLAVSYLGTDLHEDSGYDPNIILPLNEGKKQQISLVLSPFSDLLTLFPFSQVGLQTRK